MIGNNVQQTSVWYSIYPISKINEKRGEINNNIVMLVV